MIRQQIMLVSMSFAMGMIIVFAYDILMIIREIFEMGKLMCGLTDFVYWESAAAALYVVTYRINGGAVRGYALAAVFLGMILFSWAFGIKFLSISRKILKKIRRWGIMAISTFKNRFNRRLYE